MMDRDGKLLEVATPFEKFCLLWTFVARVLIATVVEVHELEQMLQFDVSSQMVKYGHAVAVINSGSPRAFWTMT